MSAHRDVTIASVQMDVEIGDKAATLSKSVQARDLRLGIISSSGMAIRVF